MSPLPENLSQAPLVKIATYRTKQDLVFSTLRDLILSGSLLPGERLAIRDVAAKLRVSEMPVRVALTRLASQGLVDHVSHVGASVSPICYEDLKDVHAVIAALQGMAAERATTMIGPADIARLGAVLDELDSLPPDAGVMAFSALNLKFHRAVSELSGIIAISDLLDQLYEKVDRARMLWMAPAHREKAKHEHREVLAAMAEGQAGEVRLLMEHHWVRAGRDFSTEIAAKLGNSIAEEA